MCLLLQYDIKITCSREDEPLGTAGPIRLAKPLLLSPSPLLVKSSSSSSSSTSSSLHVDAALDSQEAPPASSPSSSPEGDEREEDARGGGGEEEENDEEKKEDGERKESQEGCFFVCNSDVICDFPLKEMLAFHKRKKAEATILVSSQVYVHPTSRVSLR